MRKILLMLFLMSSFMSTSQEKADKNSDFEESIERGNILYQDFCIRCHLPNGKGEIKIYPPLANSDYLMNNRTLSIKTIKFGQKGEIIVNGIAYNNVMDSQGLTDEEIADIMNYITNSWGNKNEKMITIDEVSKIVQ